MHPAHRSAEDVADISASASRNRRARVAPQSDLGADRPAPTQPMVGTFATGGMVQATPWQASGPTMPAALRALADQIERQT